MSQIRADYHTKKNKGSQKGTRSKKTPFGSTTRRELSLQIHVLIFKALKKK